MKGLVRLTLAVVTCMAAATAFAQAFPARPVRIIVPFPAGGTTDILARQISAELAARWGQPVIVDNKGGASGTIGSEMLVQSAPDGHTLMLTATHHVINPGLYKKLKYDTRTDFTPIALIASVPNVLLVNPALPVMSVQELIKYAKDKPGTLSFGSTGIGGANHLAGELFKFSTGIEALHIPYKGAAPAMNDLLGGQIPVMFDSVPTVIQHVKSGKLRALGVTSMTRSASLPEVPTIDESGVKGFEATAWFGMYAPGGLPAEVTARLSADLQAVLKSDAVRESFAKYGVEPGTPPQAQFAAFYAAELDKWARVIERAGVKQE